MSKETNIDLETIIPTGRQNAVTRAWLSAKTGIPDRALRMAIAESASPIVNLGYGYFIPDMNDEMDVMEMRAYCAQERSRIASLEEKLSAKFGQYEETHA